MHGETPYIMAIAMMYESPTVITELNEGSKRQIGIVASAKTAKTNQYKSVGFVNKSQLAHNVIGAAKTARRII
jgi:hypothetical protein